MSNFYNNLSSNGVFFFWIVVFLLIFLVFLTIILFNKYNKLRKLISEKEREDNSTINDVIVNEEVKSLSENIEVKEAEKKELEEVKELENIKPVEENIEIKPLNEEKVEVGPYRKNVLREMNTRMQTSPINIEREEEDITKGIDLGEDMTSPLLDMEDNYEVNDGMRYASEALSKMEEEVGPSNIELNDYEKKQEEEAIISYDELLKVKDKIYNITEDEETDEFIDELKSLRFDLQ